MRYLFISITFLISLFFIGCSSSPPPERPPIEELTYTGDAEITVNSNRPARITDNPQLAESQIIYETNCAHCHGYFLEGQLYSTLENTLDIGLHTVPPHDSDGHTWQHPDQLLVLTIQQGIQNPLNHFPMNGYEGALSEDEILGIIDYMRLYWTDEQIDYQAWLTQQYAERNSE